jgi:ElaB/YqjD/DUF883 family membrane-anchored ribosome-binding protein
MKLFSFEDEMTQDVQPAGDEVSSVEATVNEAAVEAEQEHPDEEIVAVDSAIEAGDDLEHVEEFVEKQEEQGGMDEDTAEAVKIAVEAIARRVGYNPKNIYQLYATESFASSSSRKVNTQLAMEGVKDFLKNLWEKIKAFVVKIWGKIKEFWDKHFSTVGRLIKKLEALGEKISESSGTRKDTGGKDIKAPADIARAFRTTSTLSIADVKEYVTEARVFAEGLKAKVAGGVQNTLNEAQGNLNKITSELAKAEKLSKEEAEQFAKELQESFEADDHAKEYNVMAVKQILDVQGFDGEEKVVLSKVVGGKKLVVEADESRASIALISSDDATDANLDMVVASKKDLADLNRDMIKMLNAYIYMKDNANKVNEAVNKFIKNTDKVVTEATNKAFGENNKAKATAEKVLSKQIYNFSRVSAFFANVFKMTKTIVISTTQAGVRYITFTLKQYKAAE